MAYPTKDEIRKKLDEADKAIANCEFVSIYDLIDANVMIEQARLGLRNREFEVIEADAKILKQDLYKRCKLVRR